MLVKYRLFTKTYRISKPSSSSLTAPVRGVKWIGKGALVIDKRTTIHAKSLLIQTNVCMYVLVPATLARRSHADAMGDILDNLETPRDLTCHQIKQWYQHLPLYDHHAGPSSEI